METIKKLFNSEKFSKQFSSIVAILFGFVVGAVVLLAFGYNPVTAYEKLITGAFSSPRNIGNILLIATPYIIVGLSAAYGFRAGVVNIGISGQMYFGGLCTVVVGALVDLPSFIHPIAAIGAGVLGGALWAFIPALMKLKLGTSEIFTTIMMNYISLHLVVYASKKIVPSDVAVQSARVKDSALIRSDAISSLFGGSYVNIGIFIALIAAFVYIIYFGKTVSGYKMKAVGNNPNAAKYAGINTNVNAFLSLVISGAIAGLAAGVFYTGYTTHLELGALPTYGFDGITVALIGANGGIGIIFAGLLFGVMYAGGAFMSVAAGVPSEIVSIILALVIYFAAATTYIQNNYEKLLRKLRGGKNG